MALTLGRGLVQDVVYRAANELLLQLCGLGAIAKHVRHFAAAVAELEC